MQLQYPVKQQAATLMTSQQNPNKCKNRCPTPHPDRLFNFKSDIESEDPFTTTCNDRLFTFQSDSESEDQYTATCNELLMSNMDSVTTSLFQP